MNQIEITCENDELLSLKINNAGKSLNTETDFIKEIKLQLDEYFSGKRHAFYIKINLKGTNFQKKVWQALQKIPYGQTKSYSDIAAIVGNSNAQRAVGLACNKNPVMIIVPCHRVISRNGTIGGFAYGNDIKQKLLEIENSPSTKNYC